MKQKNNPQTKPDRVESDKCRSNVADVQRENAIRRDKSSDNPHVTSSRKEVRCTKKVTCRMTDNANKYAGSADIFKNTIVKLEKEIASKDTFPMSTLAQLTLAKSLSQKVSDILDKIIKRNTYDGDCCKCVIELKKELEEI